MSRLSRLRHLLRRWLAGGRQERALDDEIRAYLEADIDARVKAGASPTQARREAVLDLGGVEQVKVRVREGRVGAWMDGLLRDGRDGARALRRTPGVAIAVAGSLAIGVASMIVFLAFTNALAFHRTPGVSDPERVLELRIESAEDNRSWRPVRVSSPGYGVLADGLGDLADVAAFDVETAAVTLPAARMLRVAFVTQNYFDVLQVRPSAGRLISLPDHAATDVVVLSHRLWTRELDAAPDVVGRVIHLRGLPIVVIGVAPLEFDGVWTEAHEPKLPDVWVPLALRDRMPASTWDAPPATVTSSLDLDLVARLRTGVEAAAVQTRAATLGAAVAALPDRGGLTMTSAGRPPQAADARQVVAEPLGQRVRQWWRPMVALAFPVPLLVLLIACVNATNLLLARAAEREPEFAVRVAIGAGRGRIVRLLLIESLILACLSAAVAVPLALAGRRLAEDAFQITMPFDAAVGLGALLTVVLSAVALGLGPALRVAARPPARGLGLGHAGAAAPAHPRFQRALVAGQVAASLALLAVGGQLVALTQLDGRQFGTNPDQLVVATFDLRDANLPPDRAAEFYDRLLERLSARIEVAAAGAINANGMITHYPPYGPDDGGRYAGGHASGDVFAALGLRVTAGRSFEPGDRLSARPSVAIVNEPFAAQVLGGQPLGRVLDVRANEQGRPVPVQVVGVVEAEVVQRGGRGQPAVYVPVALSPRPQWTFYLKARTTARALTPVVRAIAQDLDAGVPVKTLGSLTEVNRLRRDAALLTSLAEASTLLGQIALALAAWGLYALMSHLVILRAREFAVRIALGAGAPGILRLVARQAGMLASLGCAAGALLGLGLGMVLQAEWAGTPAATIAPMAGPMALLTGIMTLASFVPAWRAARVDPNILLKDA